MGEEKPQEPPKQTGQTENLPVKDNKGRFVAGGPGGPGRPVGSVNRKHNHEGRRYLADKGYDSIKKIHTLSEQNDLDGELYFRIHSFLYKIQYQDPDTEKDVVDTTAEIVKEADSIAKDAQTLIDQALRPEDK